MLPPQCIPEAPLLEWIKAVNPAAIVAVLVAVLVGFFVNRRLERQKASLTESLERLKRDLQDTLAKRARQADYLRAQLEKLYGPLAFLVESSACHLATYANINAAYNEYFSSQSNHVKARGEAERVIDTMNRYGELVVSNNQEAVAVLRAGWGWLDVDDMPDASQYLTDVARHSVEFAEKKSLPLEFYMKESRLESALGSPSLIRPALIERVRRKLQEKQAKLSGLSRVE